MADEIKNEKESQDIFVQIPKFYSNSTKFTSSYYDIQMGFGRVAINNLQEPSVPMLEAQFMVQMSPQHFKVFVDLAQKKIEEYEDQYGKIPSPPAVEKTEKE